MITGFVLMSEISGRKWRAHLGILYHIPFVLGHLSLSLFAYLCYQDWRYFQLLISIPSVLFIVGFWLLPESPRWLLAVGKIEESIKNAEKIAKVNGMPIEPIREAIKTEAERRKAANTELKKGKFMDQFKTGFMSYITISLYCNWLAITCAYYGMAQLASAFTTSFYVNNSLAAIMQLPGVLFLCWSVHYLGRKNSQLIGNSVAAICCFACAFTTPSYMIIPASLAMFGLGCAFPAIYVLSGELFPTVIRSIGTGSASSFGRVGGMASPMFEYLKKFSLAIPPLIFAGMLIVACILTYFLPETIGRDLPNSIEDMESFKKTRKTKLDTNKTEEAEKKT